MPVPVLPTRRIFPPDVPPGTKLQGPASYFASIEKTYGKPVQDWLDVVAVRIEGGARHMEVVAWLKSEHAMGHGHASAIVAYVRGGLDGAGGEAGASARSRRRVSRPSPPREVPGPAKVSGSVPPEFPDGTRCDGVGLCL